MPGIRNIIGAPCGFRTAHPLIVIVCVFLGACIDYGEPNRSLAPVEPEADISTVEVSEDTPAPSSPTAPPSTQERQRTAREQLAQEQQEKHVHRRTIETQKLSAPAQLGRRLFYENRLSHPGANLTASCRSCHLPRDATEGERVFADLRPRSVTPSNARGKKLETLRNTPSLLNVSQNAYFNHDGEFESLRELLRAKIISTHFGWLPDDRDRALDEIWALILNDIGEDAIAEGTYIEEFRAALDLDIPSLAREQVVDAVVDALIAYLDTLRASYTAPYDAFVYLNRINEGLDEEGDDPVAFSGRLFGRLANQEGRVLVKFPPGFDEDAYRGLKIFYATSGSARVGNCVACHYPPDFTDDLFHNTGVSQEAYDAVWGKDQFLALAVPDAADATRPSARTRSFPADASPGVADLGYWNFANPETSLLRKPNESENAFLARMVGAFKTPSLRNLQWSDPFMHNGAYATVEDAIAQKIRACARAQADALRNPDPEFAAMRIDEDDIAPLATFLRTLNEIDEESFRQFVLDATIRPDPWE
ncbi:MAG: hypothetical protein IID08_04180 [Candidatus Hydrogenedentes bacterium]|nr:hypothetical protein [Candidatus Hydrogenedentota bacterium]